MVALVAVLLGAGLFGVIELADRALMTRTPPHLTAWAAVDLLAYALAMLVLLGVFRGAFRSRRVLLVPIAVLVFTVLLPFVAGLLAAVAEVGTSGALAFVNVPLRAAFTFFLELPTLLLPTVAASAAILAWLARRTTRVAPRAHHG